MNIANLKWTDWKSISEPCDHEGPGVYLVRLVHQGKPQLINRFKGTDRTGILTIGESRNIENRRRNFLRAMTSCYQHSAGNLLYLIVNFCKYKPSVTVEHVEWCYAAIDTKDLAKHAEANLVRAYIMAHCEPPPLNSAIPDRYGAKYGEWVVPDPKSIRGKREMRVEAQRMVAFIKSKGAAGATGAELNAEFGKYTTFKSFLTGKGVKLRVEGQGRAMRYLIA